MNVYLIVAIIFIVLTLAGVPLLRRAVVNSVENSLLRQDFAAFDKKIEKWYIKLFIPPFNVDFLKLNRALMGENRKDIDQMFEHFDHVNLTDQQKENVYMRGFEYYMSQHDKRLTDKYYELIKGLGDEQMTLYTDLLYDIYVLKGWTHLDEMLAQEEAAPKGQRLEIYTMIMAMYQNKGDEENVQKYMDKMENEANEMMEKK